MIATCRMCSDAYCDICDADLCGCATGLCVDCATRAACPECRDYEPTEITR